MGRGVRAASDTEAIGATPRAAIGAGRPKVAIRAPVAPSKAENWSPRGSRHSVTTRPSRRKARVFNCPAHAGMLAASDGAPTAPS